MAVKKLINLNTDGTQVEYSGIIASVGALSAGEIPALDSAGKLDITTMPVGFGQDAVTAVAGEALSAGDMVYFNASGAVLKADATAIAKQARGYVTSAVANAANATVFFDDSNTALTGLTPGLTYYLSVTSGGVTTTPTTTSGQIVQEIGFAASATTLRVNIQEPIIRI
jgi:hypothetical protein